MYKNMFCCHILNIMAVKMDNLTDVFMWMQGLETVEPYKSVELSANGVEYTNVCTWHLSIVLYVAVTIWIMK